MRGHFLYNKVSTFKLILINGGAYEKKTNSVSYTLTSCSYKLLAFLHCPGRRFFYRKYNTSQNKNNNYQTWKNI